MQEASDIYTPRFLGTDELKMALQDQKFWGGLGEAGRKPQLFKSWIRALPKFLSRRIKWISRQRNFRHFVRVGIQSVLSYMECFSSVTVASQSEPV